jgi:hypothetical protein
MKTTSLAGLALALVTTVIALPAHADPLTIDGNFADWGIRNNGTVAGWTPNSGVLYTVEDQSNANGGYLSPGWGGQAYDAEALYLTWYTKHRRPDLPGPGPDHRSRPEHRPPAATATAAATSPSTSAVTAALNSEFSLPTAAAPCCQGDVVAPPMPTGPPACGAPRRLRPRQLHLRHQGQWRHRCGQCRHGHLQQLRQHGHAGRQSLVLRAGDPGIRLWQPLGQGATPSESFNVQWTMLCANDIIIIDPPAATVAEPASLALVLGAFGLAGVARRRRPVSQ